MRLWLHQDDGFTILELLVVLAIITLGLALAQPLIGRTADRLRLESAQIALLNALKTTRAAAIIRGTEASLVIDLNARTFRSPPLPATMLPAKVELALKVAGLEATDRSHAEIRFYPDGSSTGGDLTLKLDDRTARLCVHWLTGLPRDGCD
ncbi:GspH/FimT family pseudopilin [Bradyrhizobium yuanmingense]|uniref:GspH/FimT family pseudopilin n=1 Tax=Bradyrhizobium yuanmingense TaxID=108015 RepID=UPI0023B9CC88|nr:GspH/FimT family pseudopilin [Bradyrhizobium yuanmingense]MDF0584156.1 prepilin-type N-terminal cleavage/methylation domain-containing protein [Bradyrhizobium yuanmingense]